MEICVYKLGVASKRAAGAFFGKKKCSWIVFEYVNHDKSKN